MLNNLVEGLFRRVEIQWLVGLKLGPSSGFRWLMFLRAAGSFWLSELGTVQKMPFSLYVTYVCEYIYIYIFIYNRIYIYIHIHIMYLFNQAPPLCPVSSAAFLF